jgi:glutamate formiminotransferase/formiminotetrahydrofolate cyclodeaminase
MQLAQAAVKVGNPNSVTDAAVGAQVAFAGVRGGLWNVVINLKDLSDPAYVAQLQERSAALLAQAQALAAESGALVDGKLTELLFRRKVT